LPVNSSDPFFPLNNNPATSVAWMPGLDENKVFELIGDYDGNGEVDTGDYLIYLEQLGQSGPGLAADGDDNGTVTENDLTIRNNNLGNTLFVDGVQFG
jgi:hypothetical protein